ncbi:MAG: hypothetical protein HY986_04795 [Candidatus Melainabacteria bacterium]|nr:hypothetical protein [Candidatus Melainabacteria bacterium]
MSKVKGVSRKTRTLSALVLCLFLGQASGGAALAQMPHVESQTPSQAQDCQPNTQVQAATFDTTETKAQEAVLEQKDIPPALLVDGQENQTDKPLALAAAATSDGSAVSRPVSEDAPAPVLRGLSEPETFKLGATFTELESLSTQAARKELELLKLNARYRVESTKTDKYKPWRTSIFNLGSYVFSNIGIDHIAYARWRTWQQPATAGKPFLEFGPAFLITGHSIATVGVMTEVALDVKRAYQLKKIGFDETSYRKNVTSLRKDIDSLLEKRSAALANTPFTDSAEKAAAERETRILKAVRDGALTEYKNFCLRGKTFRVGRNVGNFMTFAGATTGGYMGALCGLLAISNRNPRIAGPGGLGFVLSGTCIVLGPIVSKASAVIAGKRLAKKLNAEIGPVNANALKDLEAANKELATIAPGASDSKSALSTRRSLYELSAASLSKDSAMASAEKAAAQKEFKEKVIANTIIGGTKIGWGVQLANAGFGFKQQPIQPTRVINVSVNGKNVPIYSYRPKRPGSLFAKRVAQGSTTFIPGTAVGIIDTIQARIRGEKKTRQLKGEGKLPAMIITERVKNFDLMDKRLEAELTRLRQ